MSSRYEDEIVLDLFVAMLAVNRWTIERAARISQALQANGFTDPAAIRVMDGPEVAERLARAGYTRGTFMENLLAGRIRDAAVRLASGDLQRLIDLDRSKDRVAIKQFLLTFNGVGSEVASNFLALRS